MSDNDLTYVKEGLVLHYDAENNTGNGHSNNTTVWKDLSGNENDGELKNFDINNCWEENSLKFDGINDWVSICQMNFETVTVEVTVEYEEHMNNAESSIVSCFENGGYGISNYNGDYFCDSNSFAIRTNGRYYGTSSAKPRKDGKTYVLTGTYDGNTIKFWENGVKSERTLDGKINPPGNSTILALGTNPNGQAANGGYFKGKIYSVRIYNRALSEEEVKQNFEIDSKKMEIKSSYVEMGYVKDGLIVHYDAINNKGNGHSNNTTVWKDLSGNEIDAELRNFDSSNCWEENSLAFDGVNDWVSIEQMNYPNITLQIVMEYITHESIGGSGAAGERSIISNANNGGYLISNFGINNLQDRSKNAFSIFVGGNYQGIGSEANIQDNKKYALTGSYDGNKIKFWENGIKTEKNISGSLGYPNNNTIMVLGANPNGQGIDGAYLNGKIYSVRIYNRALTEEEITQNYGIDKQRFNIH